MKNPFRSILRRVVREMAARGAINELLAAKLLHLAVLGRWPNFENPSDFNEKITWLQFYSDTSMWPELSDKIAVKEYLTQKGFGDYVIPLIKTYDKADDICLDELPEQFVLKLNCGSACNLVVKDKRVLRETHVQKMASRWLKKDYGKAGIEPHYLKIKPRIFAEELLPLEGQELPTDYKFHCFNGKPLYCLVCNDRNPSNFKALFSLFSLPDWENITKAVNDDYQYFGKVKKPHNLKGMMDIAAKLSHGFPFVRIDLYEIGERIFFGEFTFTPAAGRIEYITREYLYKLGNLISL